MIAKTRCSTMGENVSIIGNAFQGSAMKRLEFVKGGLRENHAQIMLNVIRLWLADHLSFGHFRLNASQWQM